MWKFWTWSRKVWTNLILTLLGVVSVATIGYEVLETRSPPAGKPPGPSGVDSRVSTSPESLPDQDRAKLGIVDTDRLEKKFTETGKAGFDRGVEYAQGSGVAPPGRRPDTVSDAVGRSRQETTRGKAPVQEDGFGGGKVMVSIPGPNFIRTGLTFRHGEAFYISTPHYVANLQAGIIKKVGDRKVVVWAPVSAEEFWSLDEPHRMRLESAAEAELCFGTAAVPRGTHVIYVSKSAGPLGPLDYTPGVPLRRLLYSPQ